MRFAAFILTIATITARAGVWDDRMFAGDRLRDAGNFAEAADSYRAAISAAAQDRQKAVAANNLAAAYVELGERSKAHTLYRGALDIWQKILPPDAPEIAATMSNLGALYAAEGRYRDAEFYYRRALAIGKLASTENNLAELYRAQGRYSEAERIYRRLIETLPAYDQTRGTAWNNLGEVYRRKGHRSEARECYRNALAIWEKTLGPNHPYRLATEANLAKVESQRRSTMTAAALR